MHARAAVGVRRQCARRHRGAQVRAADTDVDDGGEFFAGIAGSRAGAHAVGEFAHAGKRRLDLRQHIDAVHQQCTVVAQCGVKCRPLFTRVDPVAPEQALHLIADAALARERGQQAHGLGVDEVLGIVEQDAAVVQRKFLEPLCISGEHLRHVGVGHRKPVRFERLPCR